MTYEYNSILFDLDGTLVNSIKGIEKGIKYALSSNTEYNVDLSIINKMIGMPLNESLEKYVFGKNQNLINETIELFRDYYSIKGIYEAELYTGVFELIADLNKHYDLYIITAKPTNLAIKVLEHFNLESHFNKICGKPNNNESFSKARLISNLNLIKPALMIGDKKYDILAGKTTNISTAGVLYGYGSFEEISKVNPNYIFNQVEDIKTLLL